MFFCGPCREVNGWPESLSRSHGTCEVCDRPAVCFDVPSSRLPDPPLPPGSQFGDMGDVLGPFLRETAEKVNDLIQGLQAHDLLRDHADNPCQKCFLAGLAARWNNVTLGQAQAMMCEPVQRAIIAVHKAKETAAWWKSSQ